MLGVTNWNSKKSLEYKNIILMMAMVILDNTLVVIDCVMLTEGL